MVSLEIDTFTEVGSFLRERLKNAGFNSIKDLAIRGPIDIAKSADIEINEAISLCNNATIRVEELGFIPKAFSSTDYNGNDDDNNNKLYIKTGSQGLDQLFGGNGIETQAITEFYGSSETGKTQLCHTLCVTVQQLQSVYKAIYVDTEGTFRSERIVQIAKAKALDPTKVLQNVKLVTTLNSARLESILQEECPIQIEKDKNIKLLIIDSIINHYRAEYSGRSMLSQKQHRLSRIMHLLQNIAQAYDIAIVITNQVQTSADAYTPPANADKPMGEILWLIQVHLEFR